MKTMDKDAFFSGLKGKRVAVCGVGVNNVPVIHQFLSHGAAVTACDKRTRAQLGDTAAELEAAGASLCLGEGYLDSLESAGADLILRTPGMKPYLPPFEAARERGVTVTSEMELFMALCPAHMTAVTGSDGKSTTTAIIAGLLEAAGRRVHLGGNFGRPLLPDIDDIRAEDEVVAELSSFQLTGMTQSPDTAVITNVAPNHLDWHADMEEYVTAKRNLVTWQDADGRAVLNADNKVTAAMAADAPGEAWLFSRDMTPALGVWLSPDGMITMTVGGYDTPILPAADIRLPGAHNVENYMAAIAAVWGRVPPAVIADFARAFNGVPHRCEFVRELDGVRWYNDAIGTSPTRTMAGLETLEKNVILIAGGYDKNIPYDPLGPAAAKAAKAAILMGATAGAIEAAIRACSDMPVFHVDSMEKAVMTAFEIAESGDAVFMSPASASFDMYKNFEEKGDHFKKLVLAL